MRHLLLDFGGPILRLPYELRAVAAEKLGVDESVLGSGPLDPADGRWEAIERGEITEREYWDEYAAGSGLDHRSFMRVVYEPDGDRFIRPEAMEVIEDVRAAGAKAGLLTNDLTAFMGTQWQESIPVLKLLDPIVDLSFATHSKPDPRAYRQAIEAMGEPAEDIVFVDDRRENVEGGRRAGLVSVWFDVTDPAGSYERVRAALDGRNP